MPRTCPIRGGDNDCNATHNKHHQCRHNAQIGRETKTKEGYVKLQEITDPNGNGVKDEKRHLLHIFQRKDTHPHIMQNTSHLCKNRHIPYQKKGQHTNSRNTYYNNVKMGRSQHIGQRPRISSGFFEKVANTPACSNKVTPVIKATQRVSIRRSVTTVPKDLGKEVPSYFAKMPQREISPTRGTTRLAAYDTKQHTRSLMFWDTHPTEPM